MIRILIFLFLISTTYSAQRSEAFIVNIYDRKVAVVAPEKDGKNLHAIISNNTLTPIRGKIQTEKKKIVTYMTVAVGKSESVHIGKVGKSKLYFYPLAPSFQEFELVIGRRPYEIPPKK